MNDINDNINDDIIVICNLKKIKSEEFIILEQICLYHLSKNKFKIFKNYHNTLIGKN